MASVGWIKLHRKIQECDLWDSSDEPFDRRSAWIDLLLLANHEDKKILFKGKLVMVKAGQRITSIRKLAERWKWSNDRVRRFLLLLEQDNMIIKESDSSRTLLTIVNYGFYQGECNTDEYSNKDSDKYTHKSQTRMIKNEKNKKNIYGEYRHVRLTDAEKEKLDTDYGEENALELITFLDEYIEMKGYKAKSHYLAIKKWVVSAVDEQKSRSKKQTANRFNNIEKTDYDFEDLERKLLGGSSG